MHDIVSVARNPRLDGPAGSGGLNGNFHFVFGGTFASGGVLLSEKSMMNYSSAQSKFPENSLYRGIARKWRILAYFSGLARIESGQGVASPSKRWGEWRSGAANFPGRETAPRPCQRSSQAEIRRNREPKGGPQSRNPALSAGGFSRTGCSFAAATFPIL